MNTSYLSGNTSPDTSELILFNKHNVFVKFIVNTYFVQQILSNYLYKDFP